MTSVNMYALFPGTLFLCIVATVMGDTVQVKAPVGPQLCRILCNQMSGCLTALYSATDLSCNLSTEDEGQEMANFNFTGNKDRIIADENCKPMATIFRTRNNQLRCMSRFSRNQNEEIKSILMYDKGKSGMRLFHFNNNSFTTYPHLSRLVISAIEFIPFKNKFIVASGGQTMFISTTGTKKERINTKRQVKKVYRLAVDHSHQLIFLGYEKTEEQKKKVHGWIGIAVISTEGTGFKNIANFNGAERELVVDSTRSILYLGRRNKNIQTRDYDGNFKGEFPYRGLGWYMYVDPVEGWLYFTVKNDLMRMSDHRTWKIQTMNDGLLDYNLSYLYVTGNMVYLVNKDLMNIIKINGTTIVKKTGFTGRMTPYGFRSWSVTGCNSFMKEK